MKNVILLLLRRASPDFKFDDQLTSLEALSFMLHLIIGLIRGYFYRLQYFRSGNLLVLGNGVRIRYKSRVKFGAKNRIGANVFLSGFGTMGIKLGNNVSIGDFSRLEVCQSMGNIGLGIEIGDNVGISSFAGIGGSGGVKIGADCIIGQYFSCHPENHSFAINNGLFRKQEVTRQGIRIGSNCWIGAKVTVLDGSIIGNNCVIAANSVVRGRYPDNVLIGGVPSKILRKLD